MLILLSKPTQALYYIYPYVNVLSMQKMLQIVA